MPGMSVLAKVGAANHSRSSSLTRSVTDRNGFRISLSRTPPGSRGRPPVKRSESMRAMHHKRAVSIGTLRIINSPNGPLQMPIPVFDDFKKAVHDLSPKSKTRPRKPSDVAEPPIQRTQSLEVPVESWKMATPSRDRASTDERRKQQTNYHEISHHRTPSFQAELDKKMKERQLATDHVIENRHLEAVAKSQQFQRRRSPHPSMDLRTVSNFT